METQLAEDGAERSFKVTEEDEKPEIKLILTSMGMKFMRFIFLGQVYYSYEGFESLWYISLGRFPTVYLFVWTVISLLLGLLLFVFGRTSLCGREELNYVLNLDQSKLSFLRFVLHGHIYRFVNLLLNLLFPYIVLSTLVAYTALRPSHFNFILAYYVPLALAHLKLVPAFAVLRWTAHTLAILLHVGICLLVGNWWGVTGGVVMIPSMILTAKDDHNHSFSSKLKWISPVVLHALIAMISSFAIMSSFADMSSQLDEEARDVVQITWEDLHRYLGPISQIFFNNKQGMVEVIGAGAGEATPNDEL